MIVCDSFVIAGWTDPGTHHHSYWNPASEPARYLLVMTPRIHRLIQALHAGDRDDFAQIFEEHESQLLG